MVIRDKQVNEEFKIPDEPERFEVYVRFPHVTDYMESLSLTKEEIRHYNINPDLYVSNLLGCVSVDEYHEWFEASGRARCGGTTTDGDLCRNTVGPTLSSLERWRLYDRNVSCSWHKTEQLKSKYVKV
jgi:hypothetical protein